MRWCQQVSNGLGLLAMGAAKHIVLFGDTKQLPPIHGDNGELEKELTENAGEELQKYVDKDKNSFMNTCADVFKGRSSQVMLNEHYRCHPQIIGFCNRRFYEDKLITRTVDDGKVPIRIRYYDGCFWENEKKKITEDDEKKEKSQNYNKKQNRIFMKEEYPSLVERLNADKDLSVCVISPYRYQLELLKGEIEKYNAGRNNKS